MVIFVTLTIRLTGLSPPRAVGVLMPMAVGVVIEKPEVRGPGLITYWPTLG